MSSCLSMLLQQLGLLCLLTVGDQPAQPAHGSAIYGLGNRFLSSTAHNAAVQQLRHLSVLTVSWQQGFLAFSLQ